MRLCPGGAARAAARRHRAGATRTSRRSARPEAFLRSRPWQLALDLQHRPARARRIAEGHERGRGRRSSRRGRPACSALEILADEIGDLPDNRTRFLVLTGPAARPSTPTPIRGRRRRTTLVVARPQRAGDPAGGPARHRRARAEHAQARVAPESRARRGSTSSGSTSTAMPPIRRWRPSWRSCAQVTDDDPRPRQLPERRRLSRPPRAKRRPSPTRDAVDAPSGVQISAGQARHLDASTALASSLQNGQVLPAAALFLDEHLADPEDDERRSAMNAMIELTNVPRSGSRPRWPGQPPAPLAGTILSSDEVHAAEEPCRSAA